MLPTLPDRTDCFCGSVSRVGTVRSLEDHLFFIQLNILLYTIISRHRRQQNPAPAQPASPWPVPPPRRRKPQNPWVMPWILQREERGCYRTLLDELITTAETSGCNQHFFIWLKKQSPPPQEVNRELQQATGSRCWNWQLLRDIHRGKLHFTEIPLEGWKNNHLQICPPGLQSHFERISTWVLDVSHWAWRLEENWRKI